MISNRRVEGSVFPPRACLAVFLAAIAVGSGALAQSGAGTAGPKISLDSDSRDSVEVTDLPRILMKGGGHWDQIDPGCADARTAAFDEPRSSPRDRLEALHKFEQCLNIIRLKGSAQLRGQDLNTLDIALVKMKADVEAGEMKAKGEQDFLGVRFGVGVGVSYSQDDVVSDADVGAGDIVVSKKNERTQPRVILESHFYGWCHSDACHQGRFGVGPFLAIVARDEKLISAFGTGVMLGWKDPKDGQGDGWSMGIGAVLDANVKSLASGFEDGKALPAGETSVRFEEKSRWSALLFFTRTF